jgi:hypothetical protein
VEVRVKKAETFFTEQFEALSRTVNKNP